jgi:hypothetical protein
VLFAALYPYIFDVGTALRAFAHPTCLLRSLLTKERGHPRDLKRKVEQDRKDREGD